MKKKFGYISAEKLLGKKAMKAIKEHAEQNLDEWEVLRLLHGCCV
jgi:hypothetical protein